MTLNMTLKEIIQFLQFKPCDVFQMRSKKRRRFPTYSLASFKILIFIIETGDTQLGLRSRLSVPFFTVQSRFANSQIFDRRSQTGIDLSLPYFSSIPNLSWRPASLTGTHFHNGDRNFLSDFKLEYSFSHKAKLPREVIPSTTSRNIILSRYTYFVSKG